MELKLVVESAANVETQELNLNGFLELGTVVDHVTLYNALCRSLITIGQTWCEKWDDIIPLHFEVDGQKIDINGLTSSSVEWLWELSQLVYFLEEDGTSVPAGAYLAYLYSCGWKWVNFDDIEGWCEDYVHAEDGLDGYARTYYEENVHEDVVPHVDWDAVGAELVESFTSYEFNGQSYYFNE
jgi:hypothetical protein